MVHWMQAGSSAIKQSRCFDSSAIDVASSATYVYGERNLQHTNKKSQLEFLAVNVSKGHLNMKELNRSVSQVHRRPRKWQSRGRGWL